MSHVHIDHQIEAYLDGELNPGLAAALEAHAGTCDRCTAELGLARRIRAELRATPAVTCPDVVLEAARARASTLRRDRPPVRVALRRRWRQLAAGAALLAVALGTLYLHGAAPEQAYTAEDVAEARRQVEMAFALVGEAMHEAGTTLHQEIFAEQVFEPMRRSLGAH
jgi:anti-sigma factor RsiW